MTRTTERERQAAQPNAIMWAVNAEATWFDIVPTVQCRAVTASGAMRVAEAEHPGVLFVSAEPLS